jgi:GGDEF domain-containing protein
LEAAQSLAAAQDRDAVLNAAVVASARGISRPGNGRPADASFHSVVGEQINISVVVDKSLERELAVGFEYPTIRNQGARGAIRTGRPAFVRLDHMTGPLRDLAERLGWQVLIMAPVYSGGSLQGLLAATNRDGPAVEPLQQYMLRTLARLTSLSLDSVAGMTGKHSAATSSREGTIDPPVLLPGIVNELRAAIQPIRSQIEVKAGRNDVEDDVARAFGKVDDLISALASRTAIDSGTGVLSRELGLAALERDVLRTRRNRSERHCVAVVTVAASGAANPTELIRLVADRLRSGLRREDLIFRYAEDEFVCSFADRDSGDAWHVMKRIQTELAGELGYTPFSIGLTPVALEQNAV